MGSYGSRAGPKVSRKREENERAAVVWNPEIAELARRHNDANVLVLPARFISEEDAIRSLGLWLDTPFDGGRHARRVEKIERDDTEEDA